MISCLSWFGHKFEPRYSEEGQKADTLLGAFSPAHFTTITVDKIEHHAPRYKRTYHGDVCVRCGQIVNAERGA